VHFSWVSSAEGPKFAQVAKEVTETVRAVGPASHFIKREAEVA